MKTAIDRRLTSPPTFFLLLRLLLLPHFGNVAVWKPRYRHGGVTQISNCFLTAVACAAFYSSELKEQKAPINTAPPPPSALLGPEARKCVFLNGSDCVACTDHHHQPYFDALLPSWPPCQLRSLNSFFGRVVCDFLKRRKNKKEEGGKKQD